MATAVVEMPAGEAVGTAGEVAGTAEVVAGTVGMVLAARMEPVLPVAGHTRLADLAAAVLADCQTAAAPAST